MSDTPYTVYSITSLITGKVYIGATKEYKVRMQSHLSYVRRGDKLNKPLYAAMHKEGSENFEFKILRDGLTKAESEELEAYWIKKLGTMDPDTGYNLSSGGNDFVERALRMVALRQELQRRDPEAYSNKLRESIRKGMGRMDPAKKAEAYARREAQMSDSYRQKRIEASRKGAAAMKARAARKDET